MTTPVDWLVEGYLKDLRKSLRVLPRDRRREIHEEIQNHIDEARMDAATDSEAEIRTLLDRLGDPDDIATDARERFGIQPERTGFMEVAALILLPVGGLIVPVLGWIVAVILLWSSRAWDTREKLIGTFFVPGGLLGALLLMALSASTRSCTVTGNSAGEIIERCARPGPSDIERTLLILLFALLVILPIASAIYLGVRLRRRTAVLSHILRLAPDMIQLDGSLVRGIDGDQARLALASALSSFAMRIGAITTAECVENEGEAVALQALGIGYAQGHVLGRPGPLRQVECVTG
ncbi:MAG: EAL domain-containing protein [Actinobacteria bacterium]|nr:EAL domain-containing protein [Actinomycetota bacterium]